jgi:DNA-directed RNA polymerase subunit H (RpoH/RPB5)
MHILQPKHAKLKPDELKTLLEKYRISVSQLPKIKSTDPCVPEGCQRGDVIKIEREGADGKKQEYHRVII